jgi:hypothetical protein
MAGTARDSVTPSHRRSESPSSNRRTGHGDHGNPADLLSLGKAIWCAHESGSYPGVLEPRPRIALGRRVLRHVAIRRWSSGCFGRLGAIRGSILTAAHIVHRDAARIPRRSHRIHCRRIHFIPHHDWCAGPLQFHAPADSMRRQFLCNALHEKFNAPLDVA